MLEGVVPMLVTPFSEDGSLDEGSLRRQVGQQIAAGADGLAILGLAGEGVFLSQQERERVSALVVEAASGHPLLVGCTAATTEEALALARHADSLGAACVMVAPPRIEGWGAEQLAEHYRTIARAIRCELMIQDAPGFIGVELGVELVLKLSEELENVRSYKVEALPFWENALRARQAAGKRLRLFGGHSGLYLLDCLEVEAEGLIPGTGITAILVEAWRANAAGDRAAAEAAYARVLPWLVYQGQSLGMIVGCAKAMLVAQGVIATDHCRLPEARISAASRERLISYARAARLL